MAESFKKIVAASEPTPSTWMALLNQMKLPSAIAVELKLDSIELNPVHTLSVTKAADVVAPADAAWLPSDEGDETVAPETAVRARMIPGSLRPTPCTRSAAQTTASTT